MKKRVSCMLAVLLLLFSLLPMASAEELTMTITATAGDLPFTLTAPANISATWLEGRDSPTTCALSLSLDNEIAAFFQELEEANSEGRGEEFLAPYSFGEIWINVQIDWAIDDVNDPVSGWHCNEFWTQRGDINIGYDEDWNIRTSEWDMVDWGLNNATETVQTYWVLRDVPENERWYGATDTRTPGVKDQLRPEQYEYYDDNVHIDFSQHTAYFRARFYVTTRTETEDDSYDTVYFSDWSETCAVGKDGARSGPLQPGDLAAPIITDLRMTDEEFNDNPVVAYTLTVPDDLAAQVTRISAAGGGIWVETEARVKGDAEWIGLANSDWTVKPGEMKCALIHLAKEGEVIPKDTIIELRCRYWCSQPERDDFYSDWSKVISFGTDDIGIGETPLTTGEPVPIDDNPASMDECPICHFCPRPLGLCIFIWLAILLVIVVVVVILLRSRKKKQ